MNVLEVIRQGEVGGGESHLMDLVSGFNKKEVNPVVMAFTNGPMVETMEKRGIKCYVIDTKKAFDISIFKKITQIIRKEKIELIHAHGSRAASNMLWSSYKNKIPLVYTVHGWSFHEGQHKSVYGLRALSEKILCAYSKKVICVSRSNFKTGVDTFGLSKKCAVIENGVNLSRFNFAATFCDIRKELHASTKDFIVGFIGRVTYQKAPLDFVQAITKAHSKNKNIKGLIVGEGDLKSEMLAYIKDKKLEDCFYLSNFRSDIPDVLNAINVFCLASHWEGLSIALLEAMAMKKALIVTPTDGTNELIRDHENGLLVPFSNPDAIADAILEYASSPDLVSIMGDNAYRLVEERFNSQRVSQEVTEIYQRELQKK